MAAILVSSVSVTSTNRPGRNSAHVIGHAHSVDDGVSKTANLRTCGRPYGRHAVHAHLATSPWSAFTSPGKWV